MTSDIEYLNQIAQDNRAVGQKTGKGLPIDPKWLKIIGVGVIGVILIMIIGGLLGRLGTAERDLMDRIYARTQNLNNSITEYNGSVKSSELRSMGNSLSAVLTETNSKVAGLLTSEYGAGGTEPRDEAVTTEESEHIQAVNSQLYYGKINGLMDRYFVREMSREIVLLQSLESEALEKTSSQAVKDAMVNSWNNLNKLETQFENYRSLVE